MLVRVSVPFRFPCSLGVKVTLIVQLAEASSESPQLLVCAKSPLAAMIRSFRAPLPELLKVTDLAGVVLEIASAEKFRLPGESLTSGPTPVPLKVTDFERLDVTPPE